MIRKSLTSIYTSAIIFMSVFPVNADSTSAPPATSELSKATERKTQPSDSLAKSDNASLTHGDSAKCPGDSDACKTSRKPREETIFSIKIGPPLFMLNSVNHFSDSMSQRGFGGGGGPMAGMFAVSTKPFADLAERIKPLKGRHFSFNSLNYEPFFMSGGMGFLGIGNGLRIGGGGMSGVRHFTSSRYGQDSFVNYSARISWGGFLIEKLVNAKKYSYLVGGYIGSGSLKANWAEVTENYSAFNYYDDNVRYSDDEGINAFFGFFELHTGMVCHVARWMHLCGDVSLPVLISSDGFAPYTKEFISLSPGLRVRVIFGNLG
jgi:hypothetical protein